MKQQDLKRWETYKKNVLQSTAVDQDETVEQSKKRVDELLNDVQKFAHYYFPKYCKSPFAKWQLRFMLYVINNPRLWVTRAWSRALAKSVIAGVILPLYLMFTGRMKNMLLISYSYDNACELLMPVKIQLEANQRILADFGLQKGFSNWEAGSFTTQGGCSFLAIGTGQNPRGTRNEDIRPDYILCDDIDDDELLRNPKRIDDLWDWVNGALFPTFDITGTRRFIGVGNIIAKDSILQRMIKLADNHEQINLLMKSKPDTKLAADYRKKAKKETEQKKAELYEEVARYAESGLLPAWEARHSLEDCVYMISKMSYRLSQREYFNNPLSEGKTFKKDWLTLGKIPPLHQLRLVAYLDPGFKKTKTSDTKSWPLVGFKDGKYYIVRAFCGQASINEMIGWGYNHYEYLKQNRGAARLIMEEVFLQDLLYKDFAEAAKTSFQLPLMGDTRKKPDKDSRIEATSGYFERGSVIFNEEEKDNHHMKQLMEQYINFEVGVKTKKDGPDAVEGAIHILNNSLNDGTGIVVGARSRNKYKVR